MVAHTCDPAIWKVIGRIASGDGRPMGKTKINKTPSQPEDA
jgi:hypothetical protein